MQRSSNSDPSSPSDDSLSSSKKRSRRPKDTRARNTRAQRGSVLRRKGYANLRGRAQVSFGPAGVVEMVDTYDRPLLLFATGGIYEDAEAYADAFEHKPYKRVPKAGAYACIGWGHARFEWSIVDAEAKGPNAAAAAEVSAANLGARAFAKAELGSVSTTVGPVKATVGLSADCGVAIGLTGLEAKLLGTGISFGRKMGFSLFGTGVEFNLW